MPLRRHREDDGQSGLETTGGFFIDISTSHTPLLVIYRPCSAYFIRPPAEMADRSAMHAGGREHCTCIWAGSFRRTRATEALASLIHPFWMLPLLGILGLKARDVIGYSMLQFVVHVPVVLFLINGSSTTLTYVPQCLSRVVIGYFAAPLATKTRNHENGSVQINSSS